MRASFSVALWLAICTASISTFASEDAPKPGDRPAYLVAQLPEGALKDELSACLGNPLTPHPFSIGHRGAPLHYPEHTVESYRAAADQGAGILECDVTFTGDGVAVCRHAQCDLHTTTDILARPALATKCTTPAIDGAPNVARCCTSDLTLTEFQSLQGRPDKVDKQATSLDTFYAPAPDQFGTLMTHAESIVLFDQLGTDFTPELKSFDGDQSRDTQRDTLIEAYQAAGIDPARVYPQSFDLEDVRYWAREHPEFGKQAVYLEGRYSNPGFDPARPETFTPSMQDLKREGVNYIAPPLWVLLTLDGNYQIVPSAYAKAAKEADLTIIAWTTERSGSLNNGGGWYYQSVKPVIKNDGDILVVLDVLARQVGVQAVFSDWPETTTLYANCTTIER